MEPEAKLAKILDECLDMINEGKSVDVCVAINADEKNELEPLLYTGKFVSTLPRVQPSEGFRRTARGRLMARLYEEEADREKRGRVRVWPGVPSLDGLAAAAQGAWQTVAGAKRVAIPVAIGLLLIIATALGSSSFMSPSSTLTSSCTLSILSGTVEVHSPKTDGIQQGTEGMTLDVGARVQTDLSSRALLTFFDGSTLIVEPGADIEIRQLERSDEQTITIVLKQWMGKTWSRVVKMADSGSHYEIQTPSAVALVRGTRFLTEVSVAGETRVHTTEGLVSVNAQGDQVFVPAGEQTTVETGAAPSEPVIADDAGDVEPEEWAQEEQVPEEPANNNVYPDNAVPAQDQIQNENRGLGQDDNRGLGKDENRGLGQDGNRGLGKDENRGLGQDENRGLGQDDNRGLGQDDNRGLGQDNKGQGNNNGKGNNTDSEPDDELGSVNESQPLDEIETTGEPEDEELEEQEGITMGNSTVDEELIYDGK